MLPVPAADLRVPYDFAGNQVMLVAGSRTAAAQAGRAGGKWTTRTSRGLGWALLGLVGFLLIEVLFESWIQVRLAERGGVDSNGNRIVTLAQWPKTLKNGVYLLLFGLTGAKILVDRRWRDFLTRADLALVGLGVALVAAGLAGGSPPRLIGEAAFVYLRGAIVFYAWRAADPNWRRVRGVLFGVGAVVGVNAVIAIVQMIVGYNSYRALGWVNLSWARLNRAHALLDHPNHLGHVLGLTLLGLLAYFVTRPPANAPDPADPVQRAGRSQRPAVGWRLWGVFAVLAVALSATQSRESLIGFVAGAGVIVLLRRGGWPVVRVAAVAIVLVIGFAGAQLAVSPSNRAELQRRVAGVFHAFDVRSGDEGTHYCVRGSQDCDGGTNEIPQREIRVLYAQQGADLWLKRPFLGYGVGQFGGIVATEHDPRWWADPRFGLHGFNMYGFNAQQVDSFWLHLLVETGAVGSLAYLTWLALLVAPFVALSVRQRRGFAGVGERAPPALAAAQPGGRRPVRSGQPLRPVAYWAPAAMTLGVIIAFFSSSLEDPIFPALLFTVLGLAWLRLRRGELAMPPSPGPRATPADQAGSDEARTDRD
ncbi:MAG: O-antigen ligase family protein [Micromonosporaceae bacterium]|nr:O-antigen ligase family protein [Micromonosporaceae bacterium]